MHNHTFGWMPSRGCGFLFLCLNTQHTVSNLGISTLGISLQLVYMRVISFQLFAWIEETCLPYVGQWSSLKFSSPRHLISLQISNFLLRMLEIENNIRMLYQCIISFLLLAFRGGKPAFFVLPKRIRLLKLWYFHLFCQF